MTIRFYDFADPDNDSASTESGEIYQLEFVSQDTIIEILDNQGAFDNNIGLRTFAGSSTSLSTNPINNFDYSSSELSGRYGGYYSNNKDVISSHKLFISEGETLAHNLMNYGNYLWGATGYTCGINIILLKLGAHINSLGLFDMNNRTYNNYSPQFDSQDDQRSISAGYKYAKRNKFRTLRK